MSQTRSKELEVLGACELQSQFGQIVRVDSFWKEQPAIIIFIPHFGCVGCCANVANLRPRLEEFRELGFRVILIGPNVPEQIEEFMTVHDLLYRGVEVFSDPSKAAYNSLQFKRSFWSAWGVGSLVSAALAMTKGYVQRNYKGDTLQFGGSLIVDEGGDCLSSQEREFNGFCFQYDPDGGCL